MADRFPHLNDSNFPDLGNVDVYKYANEFDYSRYDALQMRLQMCNVPWDMGEAHVGARTISGIGNVVFFGSEAERNAWFDAIPDGKCYRFETKFKELHRSKQIDVPVPFDVASQYNYLAVDYSLFANDGSLVEYEETDGLTHWFWFIREVEFLAPNTTRLHLLIDTWQTFIYSVHIPYMQFERGHWPLAHSSVSKYLDNPIGNCKYLLCPEPNSPEPARLTASTHEHVFNSGDMYALIITSANAAGTWGSKSGDDWHVPVNHAYSQGLPGYRAFAIAAGDLTDFLHNVTVSVPQFSQTVQAIAFVPGDMLTFSTSFTFASTICWNINAGYHSEIMHKITTDDFGYGDRYKGLAKLYTWPYAYIVLTDSEGNRTEIRIEDTNGSIRIDSCLNLVYPWLRIDCAVTSVGKAGRRSISFTSINTRNMPIKGNWHDLLMSWDVPCFGVIESPITVNDYATHFDRAQQAYAADQAQANANASADNTVTNAGVTTAGNTAVTTRSNLSADRSRAVANTYTGFSAVEANLVTSYSATATTAANEQQATIAAASSGIQSVTNAVGSALTGNIAGAVTGLINGAVGAGATIAQMEVANALTKTQAGYTQDNNTAMAQLSQQKTTSDTTIQTDAATDITDINNNSLTAQTANNAATMKANAIRARAVTTQGIANQIAQAGLDAPSVFGSFESGQHASTRPMALFSNVVVQDDYTIRTCGDEFLRYGYCMDGNIDFDGNWCVMPKFTYWKLADFWVSDLETPDMYMDGLRFLLFGGVTVWSKPEDIGHTSIYDND